MFPMSHPNEIRLGKILRHRNLIIAWIALTGIVWHLILRYGVRSANDSIDMPLFVVLAAGGLPLVAELSVKLWKKEFGSDLLAGISIVTAVMLREYLAGAIVVLMLSGGEALEAYAMKRAASVLEALAKRMPSVAHRKTDFVIRDVALDEVAVGDTLVVYPHDICPVDGTVVEGTYGEPELMDQMLVPGFDHSEVLGLVASIERYSKHPLARAILKRAKDEKVSMSEATEVSEPPGKGLRGVVNGRNVEITSRSKALARKISGAENISPVGTGLECVVIIDHRFAAVYRLRDAPRKEGHSFIKHLGPKHSFNRLLIVSGDRESEVRYLADEVGIDEVYAEQSPEQKLAIVRAETLKAKTLYVGDGINDAPAMMAATVAMAIGQNSDVTAEAADVVAMENSLNKIDEFMHISRHMRTVALQSAVGGMVLSVAGMVLASAGYLTPVAGAICQEIIDVLAVLNALRAAFPPTIISDAGEGV